MNRSYRIVVADSEGGVIAAARASGWTVLEPIRPFVSLDCLDDGTLGADLGRLRVPGQGFVALAYRV